MLDTIKKLFGGTSTDFAQLVKDGAVILDVRSKSEYASGHLKGSINVPLNELNSYLKTLKKDKPVITCCASGMRSSSAVGVLKSAGYEAYNGGGWSGLSSKLLK